MCLPRSLYSCRLSLILSSPSPIDSLGCASLDHPLCGRWERWEEGTIEKGWRRPSPAPERLSGQAPGLPLGLLPLGPGKFILHPHPIPHLQEWGSPHLRTQNKRPSPHRQKVFFSPPSNVRSPKSSFPDARMTSFSED